jgi:hypothetical protein
MSNRAEVPTEEEVTPESADSADSFDTKPV